MEFTSLTPATTQADGVEDAEQTLAKLIKKYLMIKPTTPHLLDLEDWRYYTNGCKIITNGTNYLWRFGIGKAYVIRIRQNLGTTNVRIYSYQYLLQKSFKRS